MIPAVPGIVSSTIAATFCGPSNSTTAVEVLECPGALLVRASSAQNGER